MTAYHGREIVFPRAAEVSIQRVSTPAPGPGEVLCRAQKSLISRGTETFCLKGEYDKGTYWEEYIRYPFRPGYSMVSTVVAIGPDVRDITVGQRVTSRHPHRQFFCAPAHELISIPPAISDEEATWATLACTAQLGVRRAQVELGESVAVVGLGILGQLVVQYLALSGARRIIAIDPSAHRQKLAAELGATDAVLAPIGAAQSEVGRITGGRMVDVAFDITGQPDVLAEASTLLRRLGRVVLLGDSPVPSRQHLGPRIVGNSISILGIHGLMFPETRTEFSPWTAREMTDVFFAFLEQRRMRVAPLVDRIESPDNAPSIYKTLLSGSSDEVGILFDWSQLENELQDNANAK